jgi:hypothetical protein
MPDPETMVERYPEAAGAVPDSEHEYYKGLRIHAMSGLHPFVADLGRRGEVLVVIWRVPAAANP